MPAKPKKKPLKKTTAKRVVKKVTAKKAVTKKKVAVKKSTAVKKTAETYQQRQERLRLKAERDYKKMIKKRQEEQQQRRQTEKAEAEKYVSQEPPKGRPSYVDEHGVKMVPADGMYWHVHHRRLFEYLPRAAGSAYTRVTQIHEKARTEQPIRLAEFGPVQGYLPEEVYTWVKESSDGGNTNANTSSRFADFLKKYPQIMELHAKERPKSKWNGDSIIDNGEKPGQIV